MTHILFIFCLLYTSCEQTCFFTFQFRLEGNIRTAFQKKQGCFLIGLSLIHIYQVFGRYKKIHDALAPLYH